MPGNSPIARRFQAATPRRAISPSAPGERRLQSRPPPPALSRAARASLQPEGRRDVGAGRCPGGRSPGHPPTVRRGEETGPPRVRRRPTARRCDTQDKCGNASLPGRTACRTAGRRVRMAASRPAILVTRRRRRLRAGLHRPGRAWGRGPRRDLWPGRDVRRRPCRGCNACRCRLRPWRRHRCAGPLAPLAQNVPWFEWDEDGLTL